MNEYKIEVANEAESKEAQELFFELGYEWLGEEKSIHLLDTPYLFAHENSKITCADKRLIGLFEARPYQQVTLPQLRILAMLKRNDVSDATHVDKDGDKWFISSDDCYFHDCDKWLEISLAEAHHYGAKPITTNDPHSQGFVCRKVGLPTDRALDLLIRHLGISCLGSLSPSNLNGFTM